MLSIIDQKLFSGPEKGEHDLDRDINVGDLLIKRASGKVQVLKNGCKGGTPVQQPPEPIDSTSCHGM